MIHLPLAVLLAAAQPLTLKPGAVVERVPCGPELRFSYELYVPSAFDPAKTWPILYVFDPRKRGRQALELFQPEAERLGYLVASSNDTESDTNDSRPSYTAVQSMWEHTHQTLPLAPGRALATGFSGGARLSTALGAAARDGLSGVFLVGAGFALPDAVPKDTSFGVYATVGHLDFNYFEMRALDLQLEKLGIAHALEVWSGPHAWPPADVIERALRWLELDAMRRGRRPKDPALIEAVERDGLKLAAELAAQGKHVEAAEAYTRLAAGLAGLRESSAGAEAGKLLARPDVQAEQRRRVRLDARDSLLLDQAYLRLNALLPGPPGTPERVVPSLPELLRDLDVERLRKQAQTAKDPYERDSAERRITSLFVKTSSYMTRELLGRREHRLAAMALGVAVALRPERPNPRYDLACALALSGQRKQALAELERAVANGFEDGKHMREDEDLKSLRGDPRFEALLARVPVSAPSK